MHDARARVLNVRRQTGRSVTLTLRSNSAWSGFEAGQFIRVGVENRRCAPDPQLLACALGALPRRAARADHHRPSRRTGFATPAPPRSAGNDPPLERRSGRFRASAAASGPARADSGGSGITPVLSMLRTLLDESHDGEIGFVHYARTAADWLYAAEVRELAARHRNLSADYVATREGGGHLTRRSIERVMGSLGDAHAAVCGPRRLIEAVRRSGPTRSWCCPRASRRRPSWRPTTRAARSASSAPANRFRSAAARCSSRPSRPDCRPS